MRLNFFQKLFFYLNLLAVFSLLLSYTAPFINPQDFWIISFFGLAYPVFFAVNILFFVFWLLQKRWMALLSLIAITGGYEFLNRFVSIHFPQEVNGNESKFIRLMTYNVKNFNLYNWKTNQQERNEIIKFIKEFHPDIICFQEFYTEDNGNFQNIQEIQLQTNLMYYAFAKVHGLKKTKHWGVIVFSKYPIVNFEEIKFTNSRWNGALSADVAINKDTVRIFNLHLASIHFHQEDYEYINQLAEEQDVDVKESRKILYKLKTGFMKRAAQTLLVTRKIQACPYPVIVCGDFNDPPVSFAYQTISKNLQDAFVKQGFGFGQTYTEAFAPFRIDYILMDNKLKIERFQNIQKKYSDHYPVICDFSL